MRFVTLAALAALALPMPALAQDEADLPAADEAMDEALHQAARAMSDPRRQEQVAVMAEKVLGAMLEMPVGQMLRAAETMSGRDPERIDPDTRLADVAGPDAAEEVAEVSQRVPEMMQTMAAFAFAMDGVLPELKKAMETAADNVVRDLPRSAR